MGGVMNGCILPSVRTSSLRRLCPLLVATAANKKPPTDAVDSAGQAVWLGTLSARMSMLFLFEGESRRQLNITTKDGFLLHPFARTSGSG